MNVDSGEVPVIKYVVALFAQAGINKYRLRNFVSTASSKRNVEVEQLPMYSGAPYKKIGTIYIRKSSSDVCNGSFMIN